MTYLITQIIIYLLIAAAFGFLWGWLVRGMACAHQQKTQRKDSKHLAAQLRGLEKENNSLSHKIEWLEASNMDLNARLVDLAKVNPHHEQTSETGSAATSSDLPSSEGLSIVGIPGIRNYVAGLRKHGIQTTMDLLEAGNTLRGRAELAVQVETDETVVRNWVSTADLMRIPNIEPFSASRLVDAGIYSILSLRSRDPASVVIKLDNLPNTQGSGASSIHPREVNEWIKQAKELDVMTGISPSSASDDEFLVDEIEGVGPVYRKRLATLQILTTLDLLQRGVEEADRAQIASSLSLKKEVIDRWVSMADLLRLPGVSGREARMLHAAGFDAVGKLKHLTAENLQFELQKACNEMGSLGTPPTSERLEQWIRNATGLHDML